MSLHRGIVDDLPKNQAWSAETDLHGTSCWEFCRLGRRNARFMAVFSKPPEILAESPEAGCLGDNFLGGDV